MSNPRITQTIYPQITRRINPQITQITQIYVHTVGLMDLRELLAERREAVVDEWFAETVKGYPVQTVRFLCTEPDPFRNPVGCLLRANLGVVFEAAMLSDDWNRTERALEQIVRVQAVQDFRSGDPTAFVEALRPIVRRTIMADAAGTLKPGCPASGDARDFSPVPETEARIDRLVRIASRLHAACRDEMAKLAANETRRRTWVLDRVAGEQG